MLPHDNSVCHVIINSAQHSTARCRRESKRVIVFLNAFFVNVLLVISVPMNFDTLLLNVTNAIQFDIISFVASFENYTLAASAESLTYIRRLFSFVSENWCPIDFTELQTTLLAVFVSIIVVNLSLIGYFWSKYGGVITDRFIRPSKFVLVVAQSTNCFILHFIYVRKY